MDQLNVIRDKPDYCYTSGCPLATKGKRFVLGAGDPRTAKYALMLEAPGHDELDFRLVPEKDRKFYATQAECDAELYWRVRDYSHLACSHCGSTMSWYENKLQILSKGTANSLSVRQPLSHQIQNGSSRPELLQHPLRSQGVQNEQNTKTATVETQVPKLQKNIPPKGKIVSGGPSTFNRTNLRENILSHEVTLPKGRPVLGQRVHQITGGSSRQSQGSQRTPLENGKEVRSQAEELGARPPSEREQKRQSLPELRGFSGDTAPRSRLLSFLPQEVPNTVACKVCGKKTLTWRLNFDSGFYTLGLAVVGRSGSELVQWGLPAAGLSRADFFIDNSLRCLPPKDGDAHYPKGNERKRAEAACRHYDRWDKFRPDIAIVSIHPAAIMREPTPLWFQVKNFLRAKNFVSAGKKVLLLAGGKATKWWLGYGENVTKWQGHYEFNDSQAVARRRSRLDDYSRASLEGKKRTSKGSGGTSGVVGGKKQKSKFNWSPSDVLGITTGR